MHPIVWGLILAVLGGFFWILFSVVFGLAFMFPPGAMPAVYMAMMILFPAASSAILSLNVCFVLAGLAGGLLPDVDRLEQIGLSHRKSLHYVVGYGILSIVLTGLAFVVARDLVVWMVALSCFFAGAWLHSFMDIFDGFWADDVNKAVYEHLRQRWIRALNWIPFGSARMEFTVLFNSGCCRNFTTTHCGNGNSRLVSCPNQLPCCMALFHDVRVP